MIHLSVLTALKTTKMHQYNQNLAAQEDQTRAKVYELYFAAINNTLVKSKVRFMGELVDKITR